MKLYPYPGFLLTAWMSDDTFITILGIIHITIGAGQFVEQRKEKVVVTNLMATASDDRFTHVL